MAYAQADTTVKGENESDAQSEMRTWMIDHDIKLSEATYSKLKENEFFTIDDLRHITTCQMEEYVKPNEMNIKLVDRSKLIHAAKILSKKKNFIDPDELNHVNAMQSMVKTFETNLDRLGNQKESIKSQKDKIESEINNGFDLFISTLNERRKTLLTELNQIVSQKNELMEAKLTLFNESLQSIQGIEESSNKLLNTAIDIKDLNERKAKIKANKEQIKQIVDDAHEKDKQTIVQDQMHFVMDTTKAVQFVAGLGCISEVTIPVLVRLKYDHDHPNGTIQVFWKTEDQKEENMNDTSRKLQIEYTMMDKDQNDNEMDEKHAVAKEIDISDKLVGNEDICIDTIGMYLVRLKFWKDKQWSKYSTIKSIKINQIIAIPSIILSSKEQNELLSMISPQILSSTNHQNGSIKLSLLYRWSRDGKNTKSFHDRCDNKGATLSIVHSNYNHVCGGYASTSWTSSGYGKRDENAFLYLIRSQFGHQKQIYKVKDDCVDKAVYHRNTDGPSFGSGCTLRIHYNDNPDSNYCRHDAQYPIIGNALGGGDSFKQTNNYYMFKLKDYEVFSVVVS